MDIQDIDNQLQVIQDALEWIKHVPKSEQLQYKKNLIGYRRELKKIRSAKSERCSIATFGESQMGKSYLVSAMLSTPGQPFKVTDGTKQYDFISEINPSHPNSTIEATGVITRFTTKQEDIPSHYLKVQLLSIKDIILILCEAYYNQVVYENEDILSIEDINNQIDRIIFEESAIKQNLLSEDDLLDIREYLNTSSILQRKCNLILNSNFFNFLMFNLMNLSEKQLTELIKLLWNKEDNIGKLWTDMMSTYRSLSFQQTVYTQFDAVLRQKGTLLDVARLDEMYGLSECVENNYESEIKVKVSPDSDDKKIKKSFFSALIAELSFILSSEVNKSRTFLEDLDILDFPGARRPEQIKQKKLGEGKNLSTVFRRGKVTYLFNKYSAAKRVSTLLFCHNNSMAGESFMDELLEKWVNGNVGGDPKLRQDYIRNSGISPLFIIGTWFNKDLEYQDELKGSDLNERWKRRFVTVLEKEVLKSLGSEVHWFNQWTKDVHPFKNIYMLRDFKYSRSIYQGYEPRSGHSESGEPISPAAYPTFFQDLKDSFITNDFVTLHFDKPNEAWDSAASCAKDGTERIIDNLNLIAPNVFKAREDKFESDVREVINNFISFMEQYFYPDSLDEQLKQAKRKAGLACLQIDLMLGHDSYSFGRLMDTITISESEIYELVHSFLLGVVQPTPKSNGETQLFMGAGLDTSLSKEENIMRLCRYLGVDGEKDCHDILIRNGVDLENLLSMCHMISGKADNLVTSVESMWHDKVLMTRTVRTFEDSLLSIATIMSSIWGLYNLLQVHKILVSKVRDYIDQIAKEPSVGIISDYLFMQFNKFVCSFGYAYMSMEDKKNLFEKNKELGLNIDNALLNEQESGEVINLFSDLYKQKELLSGFSFRKTDREFLSRFPQYKKVWRWEQQLRVGYIFASKLPNYDIGANNELKAIIEKSKELQLCQLQ